MSLLRFLGINSRAGSEPPENDSVRRIAAELGQLEPGKSRFLASFAYILARVAHADLRVEQAELQEMRTRVATLADLSEADAELAVEIAANLAETLGGTENYRVTREFRRISDHGQRVQLVECLFAVAAADGEISTIESGEITAIAEELGFTRREASALRAGWRDHLAELRDGK